MTDNKAGTRPFFQALEELAALRDAARVQAHLLSVEARERLQDLETKLESMEQKLNLGGEKITETTAAKIRELTHAVGEFLERHARPPKPWGAVRSIMAHPVRTCSADAALSRAAQIMWEGDCGALPVVTEDGKLAGMISDRDVCMASYLQGRALDACSVASAMSKQVYCCSPDDSIRRALDLMSEHQVRRIPVTTEEGRLLGIVGLADVARYVGALAGSGPEVDFVRAVEAISRPRSQARASAAAE